MSGTRWMILQKLTWIVIFLNEWNQDWIALFLVSSEPRLR